MAIAINADQVLNTWAEGGESQCRDALIRLHCDAASPDAIDQLTHVYYTLLSAGLGSWPSPHSFSPDTLRAFFQSVRQALPSSSSGEGLSKSSEAQQLAEIVVDSLWTLDAELDDVVSDAKVAIAAHSEAAGTEEQPAARALKLKMQAEKDKETLGCILRQLLAGNVLEPTLCRQRLDLGLISSAGLIHDSGNFSKKEIRIRTGLFYKQNKFNLLREQSEGYSKLFTEVMVSLGPPHDPFTGRPAESNGEVITRAQAAWKRVVSLIGYFDLDPNRALDIILDIFSVNITTHWKFCLALLDKSPWSSAKAVSKKCKADGHGMKVDEKRNGWQGMDLDAILRVAEEEAGFMPAANFNDDNSVLAQVLGFKFSYYQTLDPAEPTPQNLHYLAALLIREGFLSLEDLLPHLTPGEDDLADNGKLHKEYLASIRNRIAAARVSKLGMAAPLESAGKPARNPPTPITETKEVPETKPAVPVEPPNQKLGLVSALLAVGCLRPALSLLTRYSWLVDAHLELADLLLRILDVSIEPAYASHPAIPVKTPSPGFAQPRKRYTSAGVTAPAPRKLQLTLSAPTPPSTYTMDFVFFFPDWTDRLPLCTTPDDLIDVVEPLLSFVKVHIHRNVLFLTKFLRIGNHHLADSAKDPETGKVLSAPDSEHPVRKFWVRLSRMYLLPALALMRSNTVCSVEIWHILKQFDATIRWRLYHEWKAVTYTKHPELRVAQVVADRESKGILRRLSKDTVDTLAGMVAKLVHHNPMIFFTNAVNQVMAYDNLAEVVVKVLKFVTLMAQDVLSYVILDAFSNPDKERLKDDGVNTSDWLQSLSAFTGYVQRLKAGVDLTSLLKYIVHSLYDQQTSNIILIRELIWKMTGIEPLPSLSDAQVTAMAGGPVLRTEAIASHIRGARMDVTDGAVLKAQRKLGGALLDSSLGLPLLIQVAQQRQACVFNARDTHVKALGNLFDETHGVLMQYIDCLTSPLIIPQDTGRDLYKTFVPPLGDLGEKYSIPLSLCMIIYRPILNRALMVAAQKLRVQEQEAAERTEKRLKAELAAKREQNASRVVSPAPAPTNANVKEPTQVKEMTQDDGAKKDGAMEGVEPSTVAALTPIAESPWIPELEALFDDVSKISPEGTTIVGAGFYVTFWQLTTYDLAPPTAQYDEHGAKLKEAYNAEHNAYYAADRSSDRVKRATALGHKDKRDRMHKIMEMLKRESAEQSTARMFTTKRLAREKSHWFAHNPPALSLVSALIQYCFLPRCLLSPMDADFCAHFIKVLHELGTPNFWTLMCYNKLFDSNAENIIFSCSNYEAKNYGRFLRTVLSDLWKWHQDEQAYTVDNRTKIGGKAVLLPGFQIKWTVKENIERTDLNTWENFKTVLKKWHRGLTEALVRCLQSTEFMHIYNGIIVLMEILPVFPMYAVHQYAGETIRRELFWFLAREKRNDVSIIGKSYQTNMNRRCKQWENLAARAQYEGTTLAALTSASASERGRSPLPGSAATTKTLAVNGSDASSSRPPATNGTAKVSRPSAPSISSRNSVDSMPPRPEVVKRVRPDVSRTSTPTTSSGKPDAMDVDLPARPDLRPSTPSERPRTPAEVSAPKPIAAIPTERERSVSQEGGAHGLPPRPSAANGSLRNDTLRGETLRRQPSSADMHPPSAPSQKTTAHELRETAKQSALQRSRSEKLDERDTRAESTPPTSRRRSPSPPTRPGTRTQSAESRTSAASRSSRPTGDERSDDKRPLRGEHHEETREPTRRDAAAPPRPEGRREKERERGRERAPDREKERDRDRSRREREDERERGRDRHEEREREPERDREKERERPHERGDSHRGERYRREEKERDRERKEREPPTRTGSTVSAGNLSMEERPPPARPDATRRRPSPEDTGAKRRRAGDDDAERGNGKRSSRSHRESRGGERDERSARRNGEKEHTRTRESDRHRKDREEVDADSRAPASDKAPAGTPKPPPSAPSGPRAMVHEPPRGPPKQEEVPMRKWGRAQASREAPPPLSTSNGAGLSGGDLRSRLSENVPMPEPRGHPRSPPRREVPFTDRHATPPDSRKRTLAERDRDPNDPPVEPPKRMKIQRDRYGPVASQVLESLGDSKSRGPRGGR